MVSSEKGAVIIKAQSEDPTKGNLTAMGQTIQGKTVELLADRTVQLESAQNKMELKENKNQKGWSVGATLGTTGLMGIDAGASQAKREGITTRTTHTGTTVTGTDHVTVQSGKDTNIIGSTVTGKQVDVTAENLTIRSVQDTETYHKDSKESGFNISLDTKGLSDIGANTNKGKTRSSYESVTSQAGIYAGAKDSMSRLTIRRILQGL